VRKTALVSRCSLVLSMVILVLAGSEALSAPAPFPKKRKSWTIDFSPLTKAGKINYTMNLSLELMDGTTGFASVGQGGGGADIPSLIDGLTTGFRKGDLNFSSDKMKMTINSMNGVPIRSIKMELRNLEKKLSPVLLPPTRK
jgi:hypothetical protein